MNVQGSLCPSETQNGRGRKAQERASRTFSLCLPEKEEAPRGAGLPSFVSWLDSLWLPFCSPSQPGLFEETQAERISCVVVVALFQLPPCVATSQQLKRRRRRKNTHTRNHSIHLIPERTGSLLFGQMPHEMLARVLLHTLLLMPGQPVVSLKPRVSGVNACSWVSSLVHL